MVIQVIRHAKEIYPQNTETQQFYCAHTKENTIRFTVFWYTLHCERYHARLYNQVKHSGLKTCSPAGLPMT